MRSSIAESGRVAEPVGEGPVVARDAQQTETDDEHARHRPGAERDVERRLETVPRGLGGPHVRADGDVHPDEAGGCGEDGADQEADRRSPAELVVEADQQERDDGDDRDRLVLAAQVRGRTFLDTARDLLHALVPRGKAEEPVGKRNAVHDGGGAAHEREEHCVIPKEAQLSSPLRSPRRVAPGAACF